MPDHEELASGYRATVGTSGERCLDGRSRRHGKPSTDRAGFALVTAIWGLGLITLLGLAVVVGSRYRSEVSSSYASAAGAQAAAESGIHLGILLALSPSSDRRSRFPFGCQMPDGKRVSVSLEHESGKVDLNAATRATLTRLFAAISSDQSTGLRIASRIVEQRQGRSGQSGAGEKRGVPFVSITQLDRIEGMTPELYRLARHHVTVSSGMTEPDQSSASPLLRQLLDFRQQTGSPEPALGQVTIRAEVSEPDGSRFVREALISLGTGGGGPFAIREWRQGDVETDLVKNGAGVRNRACLQLLETAMVSR